MLITPHAIPTIIKDTVSNFYITQSYDEVFIFDSMILKMSYAYILN